MQKTTLPKESEIVRSWFILDAKDKILGKVATRAAALLRGKHKAIYTRHIDTGDGVIIINAAQVRVTGRKLQQKVYRRYSGYPGGLREVTLENMLARKPTTVLRLAVERMLPKGALAEKMIDKLKVYADDKHPHANLKPKTLE